MVFTHRAVTSLLLEHWKSHANSEAHPLCCCGMEEERENNAYHIEKTAGGGPSSLNFPPYELWNIKQQGPHSPLVPSHTAYLSPTPAMHSWNTPKKGPKTSRGFPRSYTKALTVSLWASSPLWCEFSWGSSRTSERILHLRTPHKPKRSHFKWLCFPDLIMFLW